MEVWINPTDYRCDMKLDKNTKCIGPDKCNNEDCPLTDSVDLRTKIETNHVDNEV